MDPSKDAIVPAEIPSHHYWDSLRLHTWCSSWWWLLIGLFSGLLCITWHSGCLMFIFKWPCPLLEPWSTKSTEAGGRGGWMGQVLTGRCWTAHWDTAGLRSEYHQELFLLHHLNFNFIFFTGFLFLVLLLVRVSVKNRNILSQSYKVCFKKLGRWCWWCTSHEYQLGENDRLSQFSFCLFLLAVMFRH